LVGDADYYVLGRFADCYFYWGWWVREGFGGGFLSFDDGLDAVSEEFTDDVFEVGEDVGEFSG